MRSIIKILTFSLFCTTMSVSVWAQENIQDQFNTFYDKKTNSWQDYRMVKMPRLKEFWVIVSDTLALKDQKIKVGLEEISTLKGQLASANTKISELEESLSVSESLNDSISFFGANMSKIAYGLMVWGIIIALTVGLVAVYLMFVRSNVVTKKVQKAYGNLESEYAEHRDRSRENQVKLKRELQTALNTLHENRINL